jgi:hypothetical protein
MLACAVPNTYPPVPPRRSATAIRLSASAAIATASAPEPRKVGTELPEQFEIDTAFYPSPCRDRGKRVLPRHLGHVCALSPSQALCYANPARDGIEGWDATSTKRPIPHGKPCGTWGFAWSGRPGSNRRPQPWQGCALPTELRPQRSATVSASAPITTSDSDQPPALARTAVAIS